MPCCEDVPTLGIQHTGKHCGVVLLVAECLSRSLEVEKARHCSAFLTGSDDGDVEHRQP